MIITCPNCNKNFKINSILIPEDGRNLKCGFCDHIWLYKVENISSISLTTNKNLDNNEIKPDEVKKKNDNEFKESQLASKIVNKKEEKEKSNKLLEKKKSISEVKKKNTISKFFSYLVVFLISIIALVTLLDTLKSPLINIFPELEVILFNLFETLKDIKLFIIDLY